MTAYNLLSDDARDFLPNETSQYGGWSLESGTATFRHYKNRGLYTRYIPQGMTYQSTDVGSLLVIRSGSTSEITVSSEFIPVEGRKPYNYSVVTGAGQNGRIAEMKIEYYSINNTSAILPRNNSVNRITSTESFDSVPVKMLTNTNISPAEAEFAKIFITFTDTDSVGTIAVDDGFLLYDPTAISLAYSDQSPYGFAVYESLPDFVRLDDESIAQLTDDAQPNSPLRLFIQALSTRLSDINNTLHSFRYVRATEGEEFLSRLTDPATTEETNLLWLASVVGVNLYSQAVGSTPWLALENIQLNAGDPSGAPTGQWDDIAALETWIGIQSANPEFYNIVQSFRDQIATGFTGIHAGRPDTIVEYMRTTLLAEVPENVALSLVPRSRDSAFRVTLLVDPIGDPDPNGTFLTDILQLGLPAGTTGEKVNNVVETAACNFNIDTLMDALTSEDYAGDAEVTFSMIADSSGNGMNILLNNGSPEDAPELGGEIGTSKYVPGAMYYSGYRSYWESDKHPALDISKNPSILGYEIIVELSDITEALAPSVVDTSVSISTGSFDWQYRVKKLIACGTGPAVSSRISNDWALYMVSGHTLSADDSVRLLWIDGYTDLKVNNWAVSNPIDLAALSSTSNVVIRIRYDGSFLYFFAQRGFFSNWESNGYGAIPSSAFVPNMQATPDDTGARVQIGSSINLDTWADAEPISAGYRSLLLWKTPIVFSGVGSTSPQNHAYIEGNPVNDFTVYDYRPNAFIDIWQQDAYQSTITFAVGDIDPLVASGVLDETPELIDGGGSGGGGVSTPLGFPDGL